MRLHAHQNLLEVSERVDAVTFRGLHERVEDGEVASGLLLPKKREFFLANATIRNADSLALL